VPRAGEQLEMEVDAVTPRYLAAFDIPLERGRAFTAGDDAAAAHVVIINETAARRYWRDGDALGRRIVFAGGDTATVVGIMRDSRYHDLREEPRPFAYGPLAQHLAGPGLYPMTLVARTTGDPAAMLGAMRRVLHESGPEVPVYDLSTFGELAGHAILPQRLGASVLGAFGILALVIAAVGVYGVVTYAVSRRAREIGIRIALGARAPAVIRLMLVDSLAAVAAGLACGLVLAAIATRAMASLLYQVSATDAATFAASAAVLLAVAAAAAMVPARRAAQVDPVRALRAE
jgi:predicted permease